MPNLGNALFFLILWYQLFHHKGKSNLSSGKDAYLSVPRGHLVFSHIIYDRFVLWIIIINNYFYCFLLLLLLLLLLFSLLILILILSFSFKAVIMNYIIKVMVFTLTSLNQQRNYQVIHKSFYFNFLIFFFLLFFFFFFAPSELHGVFFFLIVCTLLGYHPTLRCWQYPPPSPSKA